MAKMPIEDRFLSMIEFTESCWNFTGKPMSSGYCRIIGEGKKHYGAHRFSYEYFKGPIPEGLTIDHLCCNRRCVNPEHLEACTLQENERRAAERSIECAKGHPRTPENTYYTPNPQKGRNTVNRVCRPCMREVDRARKIRVKLKKLSQLTQKEP